MESKFDFFGGGGAVFSQLQHSDENDFEMLNTKAVNPT